MDKKPLNPNREKRRKNGRLRLRFFSNNTEYALPLQKRVEQFDYCELSSNQVSRSFLVILGDSVDLVYSQNRDSGSCRLDIHPERGNSLCNLNAHYRKSGLVYQKKGNFIHRSHSRFAGLIIDADKLIYLFASTILNWLVTHLFNSLSRPKKLWSWNI